MSAASKNLATSRCIDEGDPNSTKISVTGVFLEKEPTQRAICADRRDKLVELQRR